MSTSERRLAVPDDLAAPRSKLVYLALLELEEPTADDLQERLELPKLTLLAVLDTLVGMGHAERTDEGYVSR